MNAMTMDQVKKLAKLENPSVKDIWGINDPHILGICCMDCGKSLERGWSTSMTTKSPKSQLVDTFKFLCHDCSFVDKLKKFENNHELNTGLMLSCTLKLIKPFQGKMELMEDFLNALRSNDLQGSRTRHAYHIMFPDLYTFSQTPNAKTIMDVCASEVVINRHVRYFDDQVWFDFYSPLSKKAREAKTPLSALGPWFKVMVLSSAGRTLVTIQDRYKNGHKKSRYNGAWVTLIQSEDSDRTKAGIQGICGTEEEIVSILRDFIALYRKLKFQNDEKVSLI